jgi:hypothetical protein
MAWVLKEVLFEQCPKIRLILYSHGVPAGFMMSYGVTLSNGICIHQMSPFLVRSASQMFWPQADQALGSLTWILWTIAYSRWPISAEAGTHFHKYHHFDHQRCCKSLENVGVKWCKEFTNIFLGPFSKVLLFQLLWTLALWSAASLARMPMNSHHPTCSKHPGIVDLIVVDLKNINWRVAQLGTTSWAQPSSDFLYGPLKIGADHLIKSSVKNIPANPFRNVTVEPDESYQGSLPLPLSLCLWGSRCRSYLWRTLCEVIQCLQYLVVLNSEHLRNLRIFNTNSSVQRILYHASTISK